MFVVYREYVTDLKAESYIVTNQNGEILHYFKRMSEVIDYVDSKRHTRFMFQVGFQKYIITFKLA